MTRILTGVVSKPCYRNVRLLCVKMTVSPLLCDVTVQCIIAVNIVIYSLAVCDTLSLVIIEDKYFNQIYSAAPFDAIMCLTGVSPSFLFLSLVFQETRTLAEIAKAELDGTVLNNRPIRIRFATHGAALTVRNLLPAVTNELLEQVYKSSVEFLISVL